MSNLGGKHMMAASGDSMRASTSMNPEQTVMLTPNFISSPLHAQDRGTPPTLQEFGLMVSGSRCRCMNETSWLTAVEALRALQTGPRITLWRSQNSWSPLSHSCPMSSALTMSHHNTLQHVYPAPIQRRGVVSGSVRAALQQICPVTIIIIIIISRITQRRHVRSLNTTNSHGIPTIGCNLKMLQISPMDLCLSVWPLLKM